MTLSPDELDPTYLWVGSPDVLASLLKRGDGLAVDGLGDKALGLRPTGYLDISGVRVQSLDFLGRWDLYASVEVSLWFSPADVLPVLTRDVTVSGGAPKLVDL